MIRICLALIFFEKDGTMNQSDLYLKQIAVGPMQNFSYLIGSRAAGRCFAVDPAWEPQKIMAIAEADHMKIQGLIVTHYHPDHCGGHYGGHHIPGVTELQGALGVKVYAHADEVDGVVKVTGLSKGDFHVCRGGDVLELGAEGEGVAIKLIHTPGHTPGSQCLLCESRLLSGDTLFISGCGRVDLPGGNGSQLYESLRTISDLPNDTIVMPGHHYDPQESASLEQVKRVNPYLKEATMEGFRNLRERPR